MPRSTRFVLLLVCLTVLCTGCSRTEQTENAPPPAPKAVLAKAAAPAAMPAQCGPRTCPNCSCPSTITLATATVPTQACLKNEDDQAGTDVFAWNEFLALNWPAATANCSANTASSIVKVQSGDGTVVVWQTYMPSENVFVSSGSPAAWCSGNGLTAGGRQLRSVAKADARARTNAGGSPATMLGDTKSSLSDAMARISSASTGDVVQASNGIFADQNGRWLRYERLMNQIEYTYIADPAKKLWTQAGLLSYRQPIKLPQNTVEIKSSWKVLTPAEISGRKYFTMRSTVFNDTGGTQPSPCPQPTTLGLVGLHIVSYTQGFGSPALWATFEHVDNDTVFFNPNLHGVQWNAPSAVPPYTELAACGKPNTQPVQAKRFVEPYSKYDTDLPALNSYYRYLLGPSVFANYRLIGAQWATELNIGGVPPYVDNLTMETFVQNLKTGTGQGAPTGCFACHLNASVSIQGQTINTDHSFLFLEATTSAPLAPHGGGKR